MRFAAYIFLAICLNGFTPFAFAQSDAQVSSDTYLRADADARLLPSHPVRRAMKSPRDTLETTAPLYARIARSSLGDISAIAFGETGDIYTLDKNGGRLFLLSDRDQDGQIETSKLLSRGFDQPSGLIFSNGFIYVADNHAVWRLPSRSAQKTLFVSLKNTDALAAPRPLFAHNDSDDIWIGLAQPTGAHILSLNPQTGLARSVHKLPHKEIRHFTARPDGQIWVSTERGLQAVMDNAPHYALEIGATPEGFLFITKDELPETWPQNLATQILISQSATAARAHSEKSSVSGGLNIISVPTSFGTPDKSIEIFASGFLSQSKRQAWGRPAAMLMDKRGLFVADPWSGALWLISYDDRPPARKRIPIGNTLPDLPKKPPSQEHNETPTMLGSQIRTASSIKSGTQITLGSNIIKAAEVEKEKQRAEKEFKKKKISQNNPAYFVQKR
ncbi:MAG: hypothetical protein ACPGVT_10245 [Maricaulaceae bacterium]